MSNLLAEKTKNLKVALEGARGSIAAVAAKHMTPERLLKVALAATQRNTQLLACTPGSLVRAVVGCAELGLEPNALGHAYLVPFGDQVTLIIGYKGLIQLAYRSERIETISSECVYEGDEFEHDLGTSYIHHVTNGETDASKITHAYAIVTMKGGGRLVKVMHRKAIDRVRSLSRSSSKGPWADHYGEMARKTVLRNLLKYAPMSIEMQKAETIDEAADTGDQHTLNDLEWLDIEPDAPTKGTDALKKKIQPVSDDDDPALRPRDDNPTEGTE